MGKKFQEPFISGVAVLLFVSAVIILLGAASPVRALDRPHPLFAFLTGRTYCFSLAALELAVSAFLLMAVNTQVRLLVVASFATQLFLARLVTVLSGLPNLLDSIGNFALGLSVSPKITFWLMLTFEIVLLAGSYGLLGWEWWAQYKNRHRPSRSPATDPLPLAVSSAGNQPTV